jgi:hypothetical protein
VGRWVDGDTQSALINLPPNVTEVTVPTGFMAPGAYEFEVLAFEISGNSTISVGEFEIEEQRLPNGPDKGNEARKRGHFTRLKSPLWSVPHPAIVLAYIDLQLVRPWAGQSHQPEGLWTFRARLFHWRETIS